MNPLLVLAGIVLAAISGVPAVLLSRDSKLGERVATALVVIGSACGLTGALRVAIAGTTELWSMPWAVPGGALSLRVDPIAAIFLVQVFAITPLTSIYGLEYWSQRAHGENGRKLRLFFGWLVAGMALLVAAHNAILFLLGWEAMTLAAFVVVTTDDRDAAVREAGFVMLVATRIGTLCLFAMFAIMHHVTGSWAFDLAKPATGAASAAIFLLAIVGFLLKAGAMPMHVWLPGAHAGAPSHVSAVMSAVLVKMGIYGMVRLTSFVSAPPMWWGATLFAIGVVSGLLGVAFALGQHDLKRLLAYHTVENIGIILMGLGLAVIGRTAGEPALVVLGLAGALLHVWNHGLFKSLLFLSAGSVVHAAHTRDIDLLGGLAKKMPKTSLAFLVGAIAICGLPPFNGLVSELFVYLGMFHGAIRGAPIAGAFGVPALAMIGALAVACFTKAYGAVFLGEPRADRGREAKDPGAAMLVPMLLLAAACVFIGVAPIAVAPVLDHAVAAWAPQMTLAPLASVAPLRAVSIAAGALVALVLLVSALRRLASKRAATGPTWDCGYAAPTARMQYTASSFADTLVGLFSWALRPRTHDVQLTTLFPGPARFHSEVPDTVLDRAVLPASRFAARVLVWFRWVQRGHSQLYLLYMLAALVLGLLVFGR